MNKSELKAIFINAKATGAKYIGVSIQTEGSNQPEIIINPNANFDAKFDYYMEAYDDDLILIAAKGSKNGTSESRQQAGKQFRGHRVSVDWRTGQRLERTHCSSNRQSL